MERKMAEAAFRKELVLRAARELFAERGVEDVSMDDIAAAADYTRRTLYNYFGSFDEICFRLFIESQESRWSFQKRSIAEAGTGLGKLHAWAEALRRYRREHPEYGHLEAYWDYHGVHDRRVSPALFLRFQEINGALADGLREIFRLGMEDGTIRRDLDVDLCISQFLHGFRAILRRADSSAYSFARFDSDAYAGHFLDLFTRAILRKGTGGP
jgi:AcrR family transcriptional regulator